MRAATAATLALGFFAAATACGDFDEVARRAETPEGWTWVDVAGAFSLTLPPDLEPEPEHGIDSIRRRFTSDTLVVSIDHGWYADPLTDPRGVDLQRESIAVDGRSAVLVTWREPEAPDGLGYALGLHVPEAGGEGVKLTLVARAASERDRTGALRIVETLRFLAAPPGEP